MARSRTRRRLVLLTILGSLIAGIAVYRRQRIAQAQIEFHERYG
jgi:hypothetical protein